ncbi:MAG TPA: PCRF domain-containing protein, partial [Candidatus Pacearchaeota archaeon]|nr:PCRF domain-containing protein [Candidatus Pacearchaeota archaeon]
MKNNDSIIMEIRAGVGGNEAALFAKDLFSMYSKYAQSKNWSLKVLDENITDLSGIKSISFILKGEGVYNKMRHEGGVHRVQRIPKTEKGGRV